MIRVISATDLACLLDVLDRNPNGLKIECREKLRQRREMYNAALKVRNDLFTSVFSEPDKSDPHEDRNQNVRDIRTGITGVGKWLGVLVIIPGYLVVFRNCPDGTSSDEHTGNRGSRRGIPGEDVPSAGADHDGGNDLRRRTVLRTGHKALPSTQGQIKVHGRVGCINT